MRIIVCSCSHFDLTLGTWDAHDDIVEAMKLIIDATHGADLFVHLGDVFNTNRPSPRAYATIIELLNQLGCPAVLIPGNHDPDALEPLKKIEFPHEVKVVDRPTALMFDGKALMFVGHLSDAKARQREGLSAQETVDWYFDMARGAHRERETGTNRWRVEAIFCHLDVEGAVTSTDHVMRGQELALPVKVARKLPCEIICGHVHKSQEIGPNIKIVGSVVRVNMGEKDDVKRYLKLEV